ncbi:hypothetical protein BKA63DRAFT_572376 [Paraphoma chrysanthemicola]|nr:hypothetical protein BKA63DRAFT_572376 [Paraphoma chrysanthemicola]
MSFEPSPLRPNTNSTPSETTTLLPAETPDQKLLCPYYLRYGTAGVTGKSCNNNGFPSTHRLKEHLYRKHGVPISCPRCHEIFQKQDTRDAHLQSDRICATKPDTPNSNPNLLTRQQKEDLKRKPRSNGEVDEEERFRGIYRILFPDQLDIPSPYAQRNDAEARVRTEFEQHVRAKLFAELRALLVGGVANDSKYADLRSQMKDFIENVFDSGLADEAYSRTVNSFKRRRTLAGEDEDLNDDLDRVAVQATTVAQSFNPSEDFIGSMLPGPWDPSPATPIDLPARDTYPLHTTDDCDSGANAYGNELLEPGWLYNFMEPGVIQGPPLDRPAMGFFDQPDPRSTEALTTTRKRRASITPLDKDK